MNYQKKKKTFFVKRKEVLHNDIFRYFFFFFFYSSICQEGVGVGRRILYVSFVESGRRRVVAGVVARV